MRIKFIYAFIAGCLLQSNALAEVGRYQPSQPQAFYEHHQRLGAQRYAAPQGQSVYVPPRPTFIAPQPVSQPQRYVAPTQPTAPQWHQRAQQHQLPQVGVPRTAAKHALRPHNAAQNPAQNADTNYIKPWKPASATTNHVGNDLNLALSVGYRVDELDWNISGLAPAPFSTNVNILSELEWEDVQMIELRGEADYLIKSSALRGFYLEGGFSIAEAVSGDNQDSDFGANNRQSEFSRSNNDASDSSAYGYNIGLGYQFNLVNRPTTRFFITPLVGYESNTIDLSITDGVQTVPATGPFPGLDSTYEAEWSGAYFGVKLGSVLGKHALNLRGDYQIGDYYAEAQWNLRADFAQPVSFTHEADSEGFTLKADYAYQLRNNLDLFLSGWVKTFEAEDGTDTTFFSAGGAAQIPLNEANWTSSSLHAGVKWRF